MIVGSQVVIDGLLATMLEETGTDITKVLSVLNGWIIGSGSTNGSRANASMATEILADHMPIPFAGVILAAGHRVTIESAVLGTGEHRLVLMQYNATHAITLHQRIPLSVGQNLEGRAIQEIIDCKAFGKDKVFVDQVQDLPAGTNIILQNLKPRFERWPEPLWKDGRQAFNHKKGKIA
tara:strand:- start:3804 stop:4340 length:537 start_codon:yes stop_codon:yes gene_type:complete